MPLPLTLRNFFSHDAGPRNRIQPVMALAHVLTFPAGKMRGFSIIYMGGTKQELTQASEGGSSVIHDTIAERPGSQVHCPFSG